MSSITFFVLFLLVCAATSSDNISEDKQGDSLDGSAVVEVGNALSNPLVKFVGAAIMNIEINMKAKLMEIICRIPSCLNWSAWTECVHIKGNFGIQNRTRICRRIQNEENCSSSIKAGNETEYGTRLCEMSQNSDIKQEQREVTCPSAYNKTEHGFCLKYVKGSVNWAEAQSNCEEDGGNLINIDSATKSKDFEKMLTDLPTGFILLIDGIRKSSESEWEVRSGIQSPTFSNWLTDKPNETRFPNCKFAKKEATNEWKWHAYYPCSATGSYTCEV